MCSTNSSSSSSWCSRPGFVFQPDDEQLISFYLTNKVLGRDNFVQDIATLDDICKYEPEDLPDFSTLESGVQEYYFFCPPKYKSKNSTQLDRKTRAGNWKVTCRRRKIKSKNGTVIGERTTLVFFKGSIPDGNRTSWFLYQYSLISDLPNQKKRVFLYKLKKKDNGKAEASSNESQPSSDFPSIAEEDAANAISLDDLRDSEMPEAEQGALPQMSSDESQPSHDLTTVAVEDANAISLADLEGLIEVEDEQIAHEVSQLQPEMSSIYQETYDNLLFELQPQMHVEQQQAAPSSSWGFPLSNDSSGDTSQNHCYSGNISLDSELQPQMHWEQQAFSSSWSFPSSDGSQNHYYSGHINEEEDVLQYWNLPQFNEPFLEEGSNYHT
ncbi:hypothetical protein SLEP1_g19436 [Rubroshorea leprosula]|uniref:NAC domain-containing protein n=1 Tax=Rubroshorea leprosula TaxID=152421 RepID=A0AAV5J8A8_9ROSI|nr:hypothetical protein SLEP1_g19436 [Rubroshorea leprosula]